MSVERSCIKPGLKVIVQGIVPIDGENKLLEANAVIVDKLTHRNDSYVEIEIVSGPHKGQHLQVSPEMLNWRSQN